MNTRARQLTPRVEAVLRYFGLREHEDAAGQRVDWLLLASPVVLGIAAGAALDSATPVGVGVALSAVLAARVVRRLRGDAASSRQGG